MKWLPWVVPWLLVASAAAAPVPADWAARVAQGQMLFTAGAVDPVYMPNIGNGFLAMRVGSTAYSPSWSGAGGVHLAGVFNGVSNATVPSHRALVPDVHNVYVVGDESSKYVGAALDVERAVVFNRTEFASPRCRGVVQLGWYAHRELRQAMVLQVSWLGAVAGQSCVVALAAQSPSEDASPDLNIVDVSKQYSVNGTVVWSAETLLPEVSGFSNVTGYDLARAGGRVGLCTWGSGCRTVGGVGVPSHFKPQVCCRVRPRARNGIVNGHVTLTGVYSCGAVGVGVARGHAVDGRRRGCGAGPRRHQRHRPRRLLCCTRRGVGQGIKSTSSLCTTI